MEKINVKEQLATALGRRDEEPNVELARKIAANSDRKAIGELVALLKSGSKNERHDSIKALYELASIKPQLVIDYLGTFVDLLDSKDNRMVWGAMMAVDAITEAVPEQVYDAMPKILAAGDKGSVITKDHALGILVKLSAIKDMKADALPLVLEYLEAAADNQFAMYAEKTLPVVDKQTMPRYLEILNRRVKTLEKDSQKKRIEKLLKKIK